MPNKPLGKLITKIIFPCETRLNLKLAEHGKEVMKFIEEVRNKKNMPPPLKKGH